MTVVHGHAWLVRQLSPRFGPPWAVGHRLPRLTPVPLCCAAAACGKLVTTSAEINVYDISVEAGVALRDLLSLNPVIVPDTSLEPGTQLARPCYVSGAPTYFGADIAQVRGLHVKLWGPCASPSQPSVTGPHLQEAALLEVCPA